MSNGTLEPFAPDRTTAVDSEGFVYDVDTGEVLGMAEGEDSLGVVTAEEADWALKVRSEIEGRIAGHQARRAALLRHIDAQVNAEVRRLSWWEWKLGPKVIAFARTQVTEKRRTWQGSWGKVSFRKTPANHEIIDPAAAVEFVRTYAPDRVQRKEWVTLKDLLETRRQAAVVTGEDVVLPFVASGQPGESVTVSTGIELEKAR